MLKMVKYWIDEFSQVPFFTTSSTPQFDAGASTSTPRSVFHQQSFTQMLNSETPPAIYASMERGLSLQIMNVHLLWMNIMIICMWWSYKKF
ncbi:hypothetical protein SUGI_0371200 [Cryptomeria japonica]|nr:hypothetical protein SUGI_0371200 [Cryptomeria japonica]